MKVNSLLNKTKFYSSVSRRISQGVPKELIYEMVNEFDISKEEIDEYFKSQVIKSSISGALTASKEEKEMIYNMLDQKFITQHDKLVVLRRGENIVYYNYSHGVYVLTQNIDMENMVDSLMAQYYLLDYRTKRKNVKDTVERIGSLLSRTDKRHFTEDAISKSKCYLNLKNGLLDMDSYELLAHTPEYFSTVQVPFGYDRESTCPMFIDFLAQVSNGEESTAQMIKEMFGYGLTDGNKQHKVFYLYGDTARNGKSTTAKVLCGLIGWGNVSTLSLEQIASENSSILTDIIDKQINFSDELSSKYINSSRLTAMSSEGVISINPKYKHSFTYSVKAKFIVSCNDLPQFHDGQGMKHRMISIPFTKQIAVSDRIVRYEQILLDAEGAGILNWAIEGAKMLKKNGAFFINDSSKEDMHDNMLKGNTVYAFLESEYRFGDMYTNEVTTESIYGNPPIGTDKGTGYRLFCFNTGVRSSSLQNFRTEVRRFSRETGKIKEIRDNNQRKYIGLSNDLIDF